MDLIYADSSRRDIGVLTSYSFDLAFGSSENNFQCTVDESQHCCEEDYLIYIDGTPYGGVVDEVEHNSADASVTYRGRTWQGIIGSKIVTPLKAADAPPSGVTVKRTASDGSSLVNRYLVISGDVGACISWLLVRHGLTDLFTCLPDMSAEVSGFQFYRYEPLYSGLLRLCSSVGLRLSVRYRGDRVILSASERTPAEEFNADHFDLTVARTYNAVNHLILLGNGTLEDRLLIDLYADAAGVISTTQSITGVAEMVGTYELPTDDLGELRSEGEAYFRGILRQNVAMSVQCSETEDVYDIGDQIPVTDEITGITATCTVSKKIVTIQDGYINIAYELGVS